MSRRLDALANQIGPDDRPEIEAAIGRKVPQPSEDERRRLKRKRIKRSRRWRVRSHAYGAGGAERHGVDAGSYLQHDTCSHRHCYPRTDET